MLDKVNSIGDIKLIRKMMLPIYIKLKLANRPRVRFIFSIKGQI